MKPPVDAPTSTQSRPTTSTSSASSAFRASRRRARRSAVGARPRARRPPRPARPACRARDESGEHERLRLRARLGEPALDEEHVEALPPSSCRRPPSLLRRPELVRSGYHRRRPSPSSSVRRRGVRGNRLDGVRWRCRRHAGRMMTPTRLLPATKRRARRRRSRRRTRRLAPVAQVQLHEDVRDVRLHGRLGDEGLAGDLGIRETPSDVAEDLEPSSRQVLEEAGDDAWAASGGCWT